MQERTTDAVGVQGESAPMESAEDVLTEILREGAHKMLASAIRRVCRRGNPANSLSLRRKPESRLAIPGFRRSPE